MSDSSIKAVGAIVAHGSTLAMIISWSLYHSIFWALLHGLFGWIYVIYFAVTRA